MIEKARISDGKQIQSLINTHAKEGKMLERSVLEIYESIRDFFVFKKNGKIVGVTALRIYWDDLAEIRSVAVLKSEAGKGIGEKLLKACFKDAKQLAIKKVFVLTYIPEYFKKYGFNVVDKSILPHKIWKDCVKCPKFPDCGEVPMVKQI
ncbi:MAG: GNAT family N-acetyltransferase [Candidatus Firestonebacteria bacterium RIFOXYC2_FULL_39_67]|nr:MAG: GNAT family N-acetyltransferase [Candidatus Firestonebacteria bacterium RIFOXYD2_FULL_39_29]OGF57158.1 MAG: GNAT family N-acetyltransferase [Candidatus Firestonebacteria bacterium RIFOXYC2_FULL_39_67]